jgi:hypothetical protein
MSNPTEIKARIEEIQGDLNAMKQGWVQFDKGWAKALKIELQRLQEILRSQEV